MSFHVLVYIERLVERILDVLLQWPPPFQWEGAVATIDKMTTQGRFIEDTISTANEVLPEPEEPATPMMLVFAHGGR